MSNFKSEEEHYEELYGVYTKLHKEVLDTLIKINTTYSDDYFVLTSLPINRINDNEVEW